MSQPLYTFHQEYTVLKQLYILGGCSRKVEPHRSLPSQIILARTKSHWNLQYIDETKNIFTLESAIQIIPPPSAVSPPIGLQALATDSPNVYQIIKATLDTVIVAYTAEGPESSWAVALRPLTFSELSQKWKFKPQNTN
ncbi:hypothetical protein Clacol_000204 [Clathrus columnatus]|uniref:Uncharacterized protein n=1 Tax=Clathrus columnatus TaxID=1419009 RepID=A0AAV4ZWD8_9AGAM|nr:hypothetical protein Clacol_000204 [Clathrus columnatus]